jgi:hypothetical protein
MHVVQNMWEGKTEHAPRHVSGLLQALEEGQFATRQKVLELRQDVQKHKV